MPQFDQVCALDAMLVNAIPPDTAVGSHRSFGIPSSPTDPYALSPQHFALDPSSAHMCAAPPTKREKDAPPATEIGSGAFVLSVPLPNSPLYANPAQKICQESF